jgi:3-oxoacyl-[acyl-carrier-protein] synthase II
VELISIMTISVYGIGWLTREGYGLVARGTRHLFGVGEEGGLPGKGIFSYPFRNYGRLDAVSRLTVSTVALALEDAAIGYEAGSRLDIGIIGTCHAGSLVSDSAYFRDYLENGRTLGRGNLFIYTLPTSPLAEAAIHFGLVGPLMFLADREHSFAEILTRAEECLVTTGVGMMLVGQVGEQEAIYCVIGSRPGNRAICSLESARDRMGTERSIAGMVRKFAQD